MSDITGLGTIITIVADKTFPLGLLLTQGSDDSDLIDVPVIDILGDAMTANGELATWSMANPLRVTISTLAQGPDDINLETLFEANRAGVNKASAGDNITMTVVFPNLRTVTYSEGKMKSGPPGTGIASNSKKKTKIYAFVFANRVITI